MHDDYTRYIYVSTIQIKRPFFYFYACTCTFDYMNRSYHYAIRELLVCVKNMKCLLQCFTRDESGNNINCSHPVINFAIFPAIRLQRLRNAVCLDNLSTLALSCVSQQLLKKTQDFFLASDAHFFICFNAHSL